MHERKSLQIKNDRPDDGRLDSNEMVDYLFYHNFIKPFYQNHKIQLDFPARPSGSGIHPSHNISNKRRMRGRGLDIEQEDEDFALK